MTTNPLPQATFTPLPKPLCPGDEDFDTARSLRIDGVLADVLRLDADPEFDRSSPADVVLTQIGLEYGSDHTIDMACSLVLFVGSEQVWSSDLGVTNGALVPDDLALPKFIEHVRFTLENLRTCGIFEAFDPELGAKVAALIQG